jgi:hypothetical protein
VRINAARQRDASRHQHRRPVDGMEPGVGFRVQGLGFRFQGRPVDGMESGVGFRVQGLGFRFEGLEFRV